MNLENQVCSLEYAKRLRELGVKQKSYFRWEERDTGEIEIYHSKPVSIAHNYYSAFTVAELGDILPDWCQTKTYIHPQLGRQYEIGTLTWINKSEYEWDCICGDDNEANARAKILIFLLENGIIKNE